MSKIEKLLDVMAQLRNPDGGCAWDLQQNFKSIAPYTIEEAYEVADAIEREDLDSLRDELGDLLLQVVFHARMAQELGAFSFADVVESIVNKMITRHPHVFASEEDRPSYSSTDELNGAWEMQKARERAVTHANTVPSSEQQAPISALAGIALNLPALTRAAKVQKRAARVGFDWPETAPVVAKILEELDEVREAVAAAEQARIDDELGDLLFAVVNLARHHKVDPETALRGASSKFSRRFTAVEQKARERNIDLAAQSLPVLDELWDKVKEEQSQALAGAKDSNT